MRMFVLPIQYGFNKWKPDQDKASLTTLSLNYSCSIHNYKYFSALASHRSLLVLQSFKTSITSNRNRIIVRNIMSEIDPTSFTRPRLVIKEVLAKHQLGVIVLLLGGTLKGFLSFFCLLLSGFFFFFTFTLIFLFLFLCIWFQVWIEVFGSFSHDGWFFRYFHNHNLVCFLEFIFLFSINGLTISYCCVNDFAVSPPAGFPDHPHRGSWTS